MTSLKETLPETHRPPFKSWLNEAIQKVLKDEVKIVKREVEYNTALEGDQYICTCEVSRLGICVRGKGDGTVNEAESSAAELAFQQLCGPTLVPL